jgi:N-methylhydantoinase A
MVAFGGAAPLHAGRIADKLGVNQVIIPSGAGVGSAVGFLRAPIGYELSRSRPERLGAVDLAGLSAMLDEMSLQAHALVSQGDPAAERVERRTAYARYVGQGYEIAIDLPVRAFEKGDEATLLGIFEAAYRRQYGRIISQLPIEVLTWRVNVSAKGWTATVREPAVPTRRIEPSDFRDVFDPSGDWFHGPALIIEDQTTTVAPPGFDILVDVYGYLVLTRRPKTGAP